MTATSSSRVLLEALKIDLEKKLSEYIDNSTKKKRRNNSSILYHYTNLHSLKAIIENQSLLCSNSAYLNDKKEYLYGLELFLNEINDKKKLAEEQELQIIENIENELINKKISNHFVTCFSLDGDLLSQWRAYADDGKGIAIGFDRKKLIEGFKDIANGFYIEYKKISQEELVKELISIIINFYLEKLNDFRNIIEITESVHQDVAQEICELVDRYVGYFKHSSFEEEKEFRFEMSIDNQFKDSFNDVSYRVGKNNLLVPYKELKTNFKFEEEKLVKSNSSKQQFDSLHSNKNLKVKSLPITHIIIGPSLDFELNKYSISYFLKKQNYDKVEIIPSEVPYRI